MDETSIDKLRIIGSTNTQTRRLGYIVQICKLLADANSPLPVLQKRIEDWAEENNVHLKTHVSSKGKLKRSSRSYGAKRYIKLAQDLHLITDVSGYLRPTITGKVLNDVNGDSAHENGSPFKLGRTVALLLFYQLLHLDADYLLPAYQLACRYDKQNQLLSHSWEQLISRFRLMETQVQPPLLRSEVRERLRAIERWSKPDTYLEHLILPRLHWLLDLGLLDWEAFVAHHEFVPNSAGAYLVGEVPAIDSHLFVNQDWYQNKLFHVWAAAFDQEPTPWHSLSVHSQSTLIQEYVRIGFQLFQTQPQHRISAYQLILFAILKLLQDREVVAGFEDIKQALAEFSKSAKIRWDFFWSAIDADGYLILRRS